MIDTKWDIILAGSGMSGFSLALECVRRPFFHRHNILLIDREEKTKNDRTWCFWARDDEPMLPVVYKTWDKCLFFGKDFEAELDIAPFRYRMVRGLDFYAWAKSELAKHSNVRMVRADILEIDAPNGVVLTNRGAFAGEWIFNSALSNARILPASNPLFPDPFTYPETNARVSGYTRLLQHFRGWVIETPAPAFDPGLMTFMDYRPEQKDDTRFVYVLPFSETRALIEFTVFSPALCSDEEYDRELTGYIQHCLGIRDFRVEEREFGVIPMTDYPFGRAREGRVIHIGTAGGFVKASSGYAFKRTQRKLRDMVDLWEKTGTPDAGVLRSAWRYRFYDSVMLRVLLDRAVSGRDFFSRLFKKLPPQLVFRFLDEDTSVPEDIRLLSAPPAWPFFKTALKLIPRYLKI